MPILTLEGIGELEVGDEFLRLTPDQQNQTVAQIVQEYRARQGGQQPSAAAPQQTGLLGALSTSVTRQLPGAVAGGLGAMLQPHFPETAGALTSYSQRQEQAAQQEYQRSPDVAPSVRQGFLQAPDTATGLARAGEAAVYGAAESIGSSLPGLISALPVGRLIRGALAVPNFAQIVNSIKEERTAQGLDPELTAADYVNAVLQTGVDVIPGGRTILRMLGSEAAKETGQEVATIEGTALQGGQRPGREAYLDRLVDAGVVGGLTGAGIQATVGRFTGGQSQPQSDIRSDDSTDAELAQRIAEQTGPNGEAMDLMLRGRGDQTGGVNSAIQNVRSDLIAEGRQARTALLALARLNGDTDAINTVERFARKALNRNDTNVTQADIERLESAFGDTEEGQRLISIARQRARLNEFLQPNATYGPLTKITRNFDPFEKNASGVQRTVGVITGAIPGLVANRAAGALERLTGTYSPVERFVRQNADKDTPSYTGESALDRVDAIKQSKQRSDTSNEIWDALAAEKRAQGEDVTGEQLRQQVLMREADNRLKRGEETAANLAMGDANRAARDARNAIAAESLAAAQARRQAAETAARTAREREISTTQQLALKTKLAELTNEIAAGRLEITQASARVADALAQNKLDQSNIRSRLLQIAEQLAQRRLSKAQADAAMRQAVEEEAKTRKEEAKRTKSEAEAASKEASAETSLNGRQSSKVPGKERWGVSDEMIANERAFIRGDNSAFSDGLDYSNIGTLKTAKGLGATIELQELRNDLARSGIKTAQLNAIIMPLEGMNDPGVLKAQREEAFNQYTDKLEMLGYDIYNPTPEIDRALRIGAILVAAGSNKLPEGYTAKKSADPDVEALRKEVTNLRKALEKASSPAAPMSTPAINITIPGLTTGGVVQAYVNSGGTIVPTKNDESVHTDPVEAGKDLTTPAEKPPAPPRAPTTGAKPPSPTAYDSAVKEAASGNMKRARGIMNKIAKREAQLHRAQELAPRIGEVRAALKDLRSGNSPVSRVKSLILRSGTDHQTFMSLSYAYASAYDMRQADAARDIQQAVIDLSEEGIIVGGKSEFYRQKGRPVKSEDGKDLNDIAFRFNRASDFYKLLEIAKASEMVGKVPNVTGPHEPLTPDNDFSSPYSDGIGDLTPEQKAQATPVIEALNKLRETPTGMNVPLFDLISSKLGLENNVSLEDALNPKNSLGKRVDKSGIYALAQLKQQMPVIRDGKLYQEWSSDSRGRLYPHNGAAYTQGGDLMKAMTRAPEAKPPGVEGLNNLFHSWGNLVGPDGKDSIENRIQAYKDRIGPLLELAENPLPRNGKYPSHIEDLFAEGPFQSIAVALDTKDLISFAEKRHPKVKRKDLLNDPEVLKDIAENWRTSAIPQFDGNNNSIQLFGLFLGDSDVLQATSMMPRPEDAGLDPTQRRVADIYVEPAVKAVEAKLSDVLGEAVKTTEGQQWLRGVVKNSISTMVYDSTVNGASQGVLMKLAKNYKHVDPKWIRSQIKDLKRTDGGAEFLVENSRGADRKYRVIPDPKNKGLFVLQAPKKKKPSEWRNVAPFKTEQAAIDYLALEKLSKRLTGPVRTQMETTYPQLRVAMNFFRDVTAWAREYGKDVVYSTPDGVQWTYRGDETDAFDAMEFNIPKKDGTLFTTTVPVASYEKVSGRGLSANFTHAHDAYVLRSGYLKSGVSYINPIHDSFGFSADESQQGRAAILESLASINDLPNVFEKLVKDNNIPVIKPDEFQPAPKVGRIPKSVAMRQDDYEPLWQRTFENIKQGSRASDTAIAKAVDRLFRHTIVIPRKGDAPKIDPTQILTAVS